MKKLLIILLLILLSSPIFSSSLGEESYDTSFDFGINIIGNYIRGDEYAAGVGVSAGIDTGGMNYSLYGNWSWVFNPGGGPKALKMEFLVEPGIRAQWEVFRQDNISTALSLDIGCLMSIGQNPNNGRFGLYGGYGAIVRPMLMSNCSFGSYTMGLGIFYQVMVYPRSLGQEFDGIGIALKVL